MRWKPKVVSPERAEALGFQGRVRARSQRGRRGLRAPRTDPRSQTRAAGGWRERGRLEGLGALRPRVCASEIRIPPLLGGPRGGFERP